MMGGTEKVWETSVLRQVLEAGSKPQSDLNSQLRNLIITRAGSKSEQDAQWVKAIWEKAESRKRQEEGVQTCILPSTTPETPWLTSDNQLQM